MTLRIDLLGAAAAGVALGLAYFGGLWWTVQRMPAARHPALLMLASYLARIAALLAGVLLVCGADWKRMAACLAGLLMARIAALRYLGPMPAPWSCDAAGGVAAPAKGTQERQRTG